MMKKRLVSLAAGVFCMVTALSASPVWAVKTEALTDQEKNSSYGFFVWLSENADDENERKDAEAAAQLLSNTVTDEYSGQVFNNGSITNPYGTSVSYDDLLASVELGDTNDATSLDALRDSVRFVELGNEYRAKEALAPLKISSALMAMSELNADYQSGASLTHSTRFLALENLANKLSMSSSGYPDITGDADNPYTGWYDKEKANLENGSGQTGHYETLTDRKGKMVLTGFGLRHRYGPYNYQGEDWNCHFKYYSQHFSNKSNMYSIGDGMTPEEYYGYLDKYQCIVKGHTWDAGKVTLEPTCTEKGEKLFTCSVCGETKTEEVDAKGHDLEKTEAVAPKCEEEGNIEYYTCKTCKKLFSDAEGKKEITQADTAIAATGHDLEKTAAVDAKCEEAGNIEYYTCKNCKELFSDAAGTKKITQADTAIAATGHDLEKTAAVNAKCEEAGNIEYYTCKTCKKLYSDAAGTKEITQTDTVIAATGHDLEKTAAVDAKCEEAGNIEYYTCKTCKKLYSDTAGTKEITQADTVIAATGHDLEKTAAVDAKCEEAGNIEYYTCKNCKELYSDAAGTKKITQADTVIAATGHDLEKTAAVNAKCEEAGNIEYYTCKTCKKLYSDAEGTKEITQADTVIAATGHDLEKTAAVNAKCEEAGNIEYYTCKTCKKLYSDTAGTKEITQADTVIAATGHDLEKTAAVNAKCEEAGNIEYYTCKTCKKLYSDAAGTKKITQADTVIAATGHDLEKTAAVNAKCEKAGNIEYYTCKTCKKLYSDAEGTKEITQADTVIAATGHDLEKTAAVNAKCEEAGNIEYYTCKTCKKLYSDAEGTKEITQADTVIAATGHDLEKTAAVNAKCEEAGNIEYYTCKTCKKLYSDAAGKKEITQADTVIAATGHDLEKTAAVNAKCEEAGNIEYYTCKTCKKLYSDAEGTKEITQADTVVPKTGHKWDDGEITTEPTCTQKGVKTFHCTAPGCTETKTEEIDATGHKWDDGQITKEPTCTENGKKIFHCTASGCTETKEEDIPATGHAWGEWTLVTPATYIAVGEEKRVCANDQTHTEIRTIEKLTMSTEDQKPEPVVEPKRVSGSYEVGAMTVLAENGKATIVKESDKKLKQVNIPDTVVLDGQVTPVTAIAPNAFKGMKNLKTVTIGANIERIGRNAFRNCKNLKKITIKSTKLTKKTVEAGTFAGTNAKAVVRVPKACKKAYKKWLYKKGLKKTAKIK